MADTHKRYDWVTLQLEYDSGKTYKMLTSEFGVCAASMHNAVLRGDFRSRSTSEAFKVALYAGRIDRASIWTPERRKQQSELKKKLYADHPEKHPNRKLANNRARMSFPERIVYDYLVDSNISFEHNRKIDKYFVDFCIGSLVIEVDGSTFHEVEYDRIRDEVISSYGFSVRRFSAADVLKYGAKIVLADDSELVGIMSNHIELRKEKLCMVCGCGYYGPNKICSPECFGKYKAKSAIASRKVERPDAETLRTLIESESMVSIGKRFGVTDNAVRKWCKAYGIDPKSHKDVSDTELTEMINSGTGISEIARHFGVTRDRIRTISNRLGLVIESHNDAPYSPEKVARVNELINQGYRNIDIIPVVGLTQQQISAIRCRMMK